MICGAIDHCHSKKTSKDFLKEKAIILFSLSTFTLFFPFFLSYMNLNNFLHIVFVLLPRVCIAFVFILLCGFAGNINRYVTVALLLNMQNHLEYLYFRCMAPFQHVFVFELYFFADIDCPNTPL